METISRRSFLEIAGLTGGALVGPRFATAAEAQVGGPANWSTGGEGQWIASCCNMCGGQTGIFAHVVDGRVVKIEPNCYNPNSFSNISDDFFANALKEGAAVCPRGNSGIMTLYDPDRAKRPLKRTNPKKGRDEDPRFREISWDEALDEIAGKLRALRDGGEAHKLVWFSEDHSFTHVQGDFCKLYGTPNYSVHSNLCDVSRKASYKTVMGDDRPLADCIQSKYMLFFGWNPLSAIKWVYLPRIITRARENGAKLVVVDPNFSWTAAKADEWVPIRPGTDGAMALAMGHVIVKDKLYDEAFINEWTVGFDQYCEYVKDKTPKWAQKITSVPAKTIERIAREFASTKPAVVDVWSGPGQHSNAVQGGRAIASLAGLTGGYDRPGTLMIPDKKGNKHIELQADKSRSPRLDRGTEVYPLGHGSGIYTESISRMADGKGPYTPKIAMVIFQNLMMSVPGTDTVEKALQNMEYVVVVDTFLSETAQMADIVIPGTTYLERYDLNTHWVTCPALGLRQPVVKPIFGQLAEYEFVAALGRRLGLKEKNGNDFFNVGAMSRKPVEGLTEWYEEFLSKELKLGEPKMTLTELKQLPGACWVSKKGTRYEKYKEEIPADKMAKAVIVGTTIYDKPKEQGGKQIGSVINGKNVRGFMTPSGKAEFYAESLAQKKDANGKPVDPLPLYQPRDWQPDANYPLYLVNWKDASHTHSRTQNNPWLLELKPSNPLHINSKTAAKLGIKDGDEIWVESPHGKAKATARVTEGIHPEVVGWQHGFGHWAMGSNAKGRGSCGSGLLPTKSDPLSGMALHKEICVKVYKV